MVRLANIQEIRPKMTDYLKLGIFSPRTEAMQMAYEWGQHIHAGQKRLSGEPYFETHCCWVADFIDKLIGNEVWTIAALLHDSLEDRGVSLDQIKERFPGSLGEDVAYIVDGTTKLTSSRDGISREIETLRKIAMFRDPGVFLVKLADKSHNVMTLAYMPNEKRSKKAEEAIRAYGKLAGILNCYAWRRWLEDMAFVHYDPETYAIIQQKIDPDPRLNLDFITYFMTQLAGVMDGERIEGKIDIVVNGYWQTWQKLKRMARQRMTSLDTFSAVNDLISFRMIVDSENIRDCYSLLSSVNRFLGPFLDQNRFDDFIACPQNGYRALQTTAWLSECGAIEVAIMSRDMEGENQWGVVHLLKQGRPISGYLPVTVITPTGGLRFVPEGSTVLDAVAAIQNEFLIDKMNAVKVNGCLSRISDKVSPGDVVEVVTGEQLISPGEDWLSFCNPSTARLIRSVLSMKKIKKSAEDGRQNIKPILVERGILALEDVQAVEREKIELFLLHMSCASLEDLYIALGGGAIRLTEIADAMDLHKITKNDLQWTAINFTGSSSANRPGVIAKVASIMAEQGGNIIRAVNDTLPDGGFTLRLIVKDLSKDKEENLKRAYIDCGINFKSIEFV